MFTNTAIAISANLRAKDNLQHKHWRKDLSKVKETLSLCSHKKVKNSYFVRLMKRMFQIYIYFEMQQTIKEACSTCFGETLLKKNSRYLIKNVL